MSMWRMRRTTEVMPSLCDGLPQPVRGVDRGAAVADFEVEAGHLVLRSLPEEADAVADRDAGAALDRAGGEPAVESEDPVAVVHDDEVTVALQPLRVDDLAGEDRTHLGARRGVQSPARRA